MHLHQTQKKVASDTTRFRVVNCGRGWGKTTLAIEEIIGVAIAKQNRKVLYIANTYQQARDIAWSSLCDRLRDVTDKKNDSRLELTIKTVDGGTSQIFLRGWESVDTLRGQEYDFIVIDEVASMRGFWTGWNDVLRPTLRMSEGGALFISTPKGFNHFYELFNKTDQDYKSFHFTSYDNPHLPREEIAGAKRTLPEDSFAQEWLADFRKMEGLVYKEFNRVAHIFTDLPDVEFVTTIGGHDFGTNNPCASITIKKDRDARYWVTDEFYKSGLTDAQQADYIAALKWDACYPDPESASGILELKRRNVHVKEVVKNKDSVRNGINTVRELLLANRLKIHESCANLIWEFETYAYPEKRQDRNEEENPIKENDHALDALRYALTMDNVLSQRRYHPKIHQPPRARRNIAV